MTRENERSTVDDWQRVKAVFQRALEQPTTARAEWVDAICERDEDLREEVRSLLAAHEESQSFLEAPAALDEQAAKAIDATVERLVWVGRRVGAYRIVRELGRGGMGRVFLAERADAQFDKQVAIKIVRLTADADRLLDRFGHERRILAALEHPNIARLLDAGTTDDAVPYVVMEYVDGLPIDEYCDQHALSTSEKLELFRLVCGTVHHAHQRSIIHRDIKAGNILVTDDGTPKLLDFGIAKLLEPNASEQAQTQTEFRVLTPSNAAPEQVTGGSVTPATDVYALGVLLYRLMTRESPYRLASASGTELTRAVCEVEPRKPSVVVGSTPLRADLAGDIDTIVLRALRKEPERRYASAEELAEDIERHLAGLPVRAAPDTTAYRARKFVRRNQRSLVVAAASAGVVVAALGLMGAVRWRSGSTAPVPPAAERARVCTVAVLPFKPLVAGSQDDNQLGVALADAMVAELGALKSVAVRSVNSRVDPGGRGGDPMDVGRDLGAELVLGGAIQHDGDRLRVRVFLVRVADGLTMWSDRFDSQWTDVFRVQDAIAAQVAHALTVTLGEEAKQRVIRRRTRDVEAYEAYLKGRFFWNTRTSEGFRKALGYFQDAIRRDPSYAPAYAGLADTYALLGSMPYAVMPPSEARGKARIAAVKALELDDTLAEAEVSLAFVTYSFDWDWAGGERHFRRAIELDPDYSTAHYWYSLYLGQLGRADEALAEAQRALDLEPVGLIGTYAVGLAHYYNRRFDVAAQFAHKALEIAPEFPPGRRLLGSTHLAQGRFQEAAVEFRRLYEAAPDNSLHAAWLAFAYGRAGERAKAREILNELVRESKIRFVPAAHIGIGYAGLDELDTVMHWFENAYVDRSQALTFLKAEPLFDPLRSDPRFDDLIRRVGLSRGP